MAEEKDTAHVAQTGLQVFSSEQNFELAQRMSKVFGSSSIVPTAYQGEAGLANCVIALEMANRMGISPLHVMQNLNVIYGNPSWSSKFLIACINTCGKFKSPLRYEFKGDEGKDNWSCRAYAFDVYDEKLYGAWVSIAMAKSEGWYTKKGSKWVTMPELMLMYRAAAFFQRTYAPELSMGMYTSEEVIDMGLKNAKPIDADFEEIHFEPDEVEHNKTFDSVQWPKSPDEGQVTHESETMTDKVEQDEDF